MKDTVDDPMTSTFQSRRFAWSFLRFKRYHVVTQSEKEKMTRSLLLEVLWKDQPLKCVAIYRDSR